MEAHSRGAGSYGEGAVTIETGGGFFRADSRTARDLGVLLAHRLAARGPLRVLDLMAGCGIRSLRYGVEAGASLVWANDADAGRRPLLEANLAALPAACRGRVSCRTAQQLLALVLMRRQRFELVDLDAFGSPTALLPGALEAVAMGGVLFVASSDGRSPTGHDRTAAVRRLGAAARAHPASWELALRLQLGSVARAAWAQGRGITPLLNISEGRTFRTAVQLDQHPGRGEEALLGLLAHCNGCGDQQVQSLLQLGRWAPCRCGSAAPLAVSGPLWIGPLQASAELATLATTPAMASASRRQLARLVADPGEPARCWPMALIAQQLGGGPPPLAALANALQQRGHRAGVSGVMAGQLRSDAPWPLILAVAGELAGHNGRTSDAAPGHGL
ncbi:MAG: N2,N2-dimethylguanosine tRNA methyltransferase [Cyanobacteriota bacterium]|nr:N2,N2-dimethylguanosine tRNA methyltransferase [Cyanobacteriota bacterium]